MYNVGIQEIVSSHFDRAGGHDVIVMIQINVTALIAPVAAGIIFDVDAALAVFFPQRKREIPDALVSVKSLALGLAGRNLQVALGGRPGDFEGVGHGIVHTIAFYDPPGMLHDLAQIVFHNLFSFSLAVIILYYTIYI